MFVVFGGKDEVNVACAVTGLGDQLDGGFKYGSIVCKSVLQTLHAVTGRHVREDPALKDRPGCIVVQLSGRNNCISAFDAVRNEWRDVDPGWILEEMVIVLFESDTMLQVWILGFKLDQERLLLEVSRDRQQQTVAAIRLEWRSCSLMDVVLCSLCIGFVGRFASRRFTVLYCIRHFFKRKENLAERWKADQARTDFVARLYSC